MYTYICEFLEATCDKYWGVGIDLGIDLVVAENAVLKHIRRRAD